MKKTTVLLTIAVLLTPVVAVPAADYLTNTGDDALGDTLRGYGFVPVVPPSTLMPVGSLYYVDWKVRDFKAICHAEEADLEKVVKTSSSWKDEQNLERKGKMSTGIDIDLGWMLKGKWDKSHVVKVQSTLADVVLEEIPLGPNWTIFEKLMNQKECNDVVMNFVRAGYYVCQGQKILNATAQFKLDADVENELEANASATPDAIKDIVKRAVETQGQQSVVAKEGRILAGSSLTYGVSMSPFCFAPPEGRFKRVLPSTTMGRVTNYVLFNIVEPLLPTKGTPAAMAQASNIAAGPK